MRDIIITSGFTSVVADWLGGLQRPYKVIQLPTPTKQQYKQQVVDLGSHPIMTLIDRAGVKDAKRVMVCGFSESCQLVMAFLRSQDAALIEHAIMIDGVHCSWDPYGSPPNAARDNIAPTCMGPVIGYADWAGSGPTQVDGLPAAKRYCTITHTHIIPGATPKLPHASPGTSDTARVLLNKLYGSGWPSQQGVGAQSLAALKGFKAAYGQHGLTVASFESGPGDAAAHIYQGTTVMRTVIENMLVPRWNNVDPNTPGCGAQTVYGRASEGGQSCDPNAPNVVPVDGQPHDGSVPWQKYYDPQQLGKEGWSGWQIAGVTVGALAGLAALGYGGWWLSRRAHNPAEVIPLRRAWHGAELPAGYHDGPAREHSSFVLLLTDDGGGVIESGWGDISQAYERKHALERRFPRLQSSGVIVDVATRQDMRELEVNPDDSRNWASSTRRA